MKTELKSDSSSATIPASNIRRSDQKDEEALHIKESTRGRGGEEDDDDSSFYDAKDHEISTRVSSSSYASGSGEEYSRDEEDDDDGDESEYESSEESASGSSEYSVEYETESDEDEEEENTDSEEYEEYEVEEEEEEEEDEDQAISSGIPSHVLAINEGTVAAAESLAVEPESTRNRIIEPVTSKITQNEPNKEPSDEPNQETRGLDNTKFVKKPIKKELSKLGDPTHPIPIPNRKGRKSDVRRYVEGSTLDLIPKYQQDKDGKLKIPQQQQRKKKKKVMAKSSSGDGNAVANENKDRP